MAETRDTVVLQKSAPEPTPPRRWPSWFIPVAAVVAAVMVVTAGWFALGSVFSWPGNPFKQKTIDRSQPVLLESIQDLSRYEAAAGNFQVIIDVEKDAKYIPSPILGERVLFVAAGTVNSYVEFGGLAKDAIKVTGKSVEITLPQPVVDKPNIDHSRSYVFARQRGVLDRLGSVFKDNPASEQQLYLLAEHKMSEAAKESGLNSRAVQNTRAMLTGMLRSLGYTSVKVSFEGLD